VTSGAPPAGVTSGAPPAVRREAFDQTGDHRLVLITCTGTFDYDRHSYDSNLVVIAQPVGSAH